MEDRFTDLEIRLTHQEAAMEEMNGVLLEQHRLIQALRDELAYLQRQLRGMNTNNIADAADETPPPHY
ncbi:MAG: SlyX family protein [Ectothiorhodospiraceae bacterium]|nr:SlyX family protein [Ectothiorhodospiraceae bacterium]